MDRFAWTEIVLSPEEQMVCQQGGVRLYDGDDKTDYDNGKLILTSHRLLWRHLKDVKCVMSIPLSCIVLVEEQSAGFAKSPKIVTHLQSTPDYKPPGPFVSSKYNYVRFSFRDGGEKEDQLQDRQVGIATHLNISSLQIGFVQDYEVETLSKYAQIYEFHRNLQETLKRRQWDQKAGPPTRLPGATGMKIKGGGIVGIERKLEQKHRETDKSISQSFQDLSKLMDQAKEMVSLSKSISTKIRDRKGEITEDETVQFKAYLLSLGISDPVTKDTHGTGDRYYKELAKEISTNLLKPLEECGGMMTLTDVYCRINRARGMELASPEDLINACKQMEPLRLPVRLKLFDSGVMVLYLQSHSESEIIDKTLNTVNDKGSVTAEELSQLTGISVILSKERLLTTEKCGMVCRDESVEGLRFYPNHFLYGPPIEAT